jgi:TctA family transporter
VRRPRLGGRHGPAVSSDRRLALALTDAPKLRIHHVGLASVDCLGGGRSSTALLSLFLGLSIATVGVDGSYAPTASSFGVGILVRRHPVSDGDVAPAYGLAKS